ncbi:RNA polymerase sigma factor [candidate division WOR-3 bacterium]|nr:RNA polymerase sigma factor [candidate division WOR-3 bacterium]
MKRLISKRYEMNQILIQKFKDEKAKLFSYIKSMVDDSDEAQDILQDVFLCALLNFDTIKSIETLTSWLFAVARNKALDYFRRKKNTVADLELEDLIDDRSQDIDSEVKIEVFTDRVSTILSSMPENLRSVFLYHEIEGMTFKEISNLTGIPINTLLTRKREALKYIQKKIKIYKEDLCS